MKKILSSLAVFAFPVVAYAQMITSTPVTDANSLINKVDDLINVAVWMLVSLAVLFIVWNGVQFIRHSASPDDRGTYRDAMLWGVVGLFLIISIWGLVLILQGTFGTNTTSNAPTSSQIRNLVPQSS